MGEKGNKGVAGPERRFRELRDRPAPELDSQRLWRRIEARLAPRSRPLWQRWLRPSPVARYGPSPVARYGPSPVARYAYGLAGIVVLGLAVWLAANVFQTGNPAEPLAVSPEPGTDAGSGSGGQLVLLSPDDAATPPAATELPGLATTAGLAVRLEVRLIRGYDGAPPEDVAAAANLGAGGVDVIADVRPQIESLLPYESFGILGAWDGQLVAGAPLQARLSDAYEIAASSAEFLASDGIVQLRDVRFAGAGRQLVATDLSLEPGRVYIVGVQPGGSESVSLVLAVRAEVAESEAR